MCFIFRRVSMCVAFGVRGGGGGSYFPEQIMRGGGVARAGVWVIMIVPNNNNINRVLVFRSPCVLGGVVRRRDNGRAFSVI